MQGLQSDQQQEEVMNNCEQLNEYLVDYLEGLLAKPQADLLDNHVKDCSECRSAVASYRQIMSAYGDLGEQDVPEQIAAGILGAAKEAVLEQPSAPLHLPDRTVLAQVWKPLLAIAASVLAVFLFAHQEDDRPTFEELVQRGNALEQESDFEGAIIQWELALESDLAHADTGRLLGELARLLLATEQPGRALSALDFQASHDMPESRNATSMLMRIQAHQGMGDWLAAESLLEEALVAYPGQVDLFDQVDVGLSDAQTDGLRALRYIGD